VRFSALSFVQIEARSEQHGGHSSIGRALGCGPSGYGFEPRWPPHKHPTSMVGFLMLLTRVEAGCYPLLMIYLIGGSPRSGKTALAKRLATRLRIGWVSADMLESIVREYTPKKNQPKLFPKNVLRKKTHDTNDEMYETFSAQKIVTAYIRQGKMSHKAIETFIKDCAHEAHDFIIEGHQIHPRLVAQLSEQFPKEIQSVFLIKKHEQALLEGFKKSTVKNDWVLQKTKKNSTFPKIAKMLARFGNYFEKEATKYGLPVYCLDDNFLKQLASLEKTLGKR
jgi:2-phosphoglycerate kinase